MRDFYEGEVPESDEVMGLDVDLGSRFQPFSIGVRITVTVIIGPVVQNSQQSELETSP